MTTKTVNKKIVVTTIWILVVLCIITFLFAPFYNLREECLYCGRERVTRDICGITIWQKEKNTPTSDWVLSLCPDHTEHTYSRVSSAARPKWFSGVEQGSGYFNLLRIWRLHKHGHDNEAREWLNKWHNALKLPERERYETLHEIIKTLDNILHKNIE